MSLNFAFVLDVIIAVLLIATIVYAIILNRRLGMLRANSGELERVIEKLNEASQRAEDSTRGMRMTAERCQDMINKPVNEARALRDELQFLIERADKVGEKLANASSGTAIGVSTAGDGPPTDAGRGATGQAAPGKKTASKSAGRSRAAASGAAASGKEKAAAADKAPRSLAEQELMKALKDAEQDGI